ncbi:hypothetical protein RWH43_17340 [Microbacterium sp. KSW2-21]|uniref:Uncharacterized protein n=1 Tax=Microbacterium algihabitans TaxID=3075992 RepID=A0ABU3S089_9MICO|nr:hypothetical protein [Microbacterium sp. KSW2-21]MDU0328527.1 hypothetical protein [Microbacterium sp. KSW2-21]
MAIFTGVVVGVVVVLYERGLSDRRAAREVTKAQQRVVEAMQPRMDDPLIYDSSSLKLADTRIRQVTEQVEMVPPGPPEYVVPGYWMLLAVLQQADELERAADRLDKVPTTELESDNRRFVTARGEVSRMAGGPLFTYPSTANEAPPVLPSGFLDQPSVQLAVKGYVHQRVLLDAARTAFLDPDMHWRGEAWRIQLYQFKDAPVPLFPKWWRAWRASRDRAKARAAADELAVSIMHDSDPS